MDQAGSSAIPTALAQQGLEKLCGDFAYTAAFERYGVKQATKPPTSTDRYRFRLVEHWQFYDGEARVLER